MNENISLLRNEALHLIEKVDALTQKNAQGLIRDPEPKTGDQLAAPLIEQVAAISLRREIELARSERKSDLATFESNQKIHELVAEMLEQSFARDHRISETLLQVAQHLQNQGRCILKLYDWMAEILNRLEALEKKQSQLEV